MYALLLQMLSFPLSETTVFLWRYTALNNIVHGLSYVSLHAKLADTLQTALLSVSYGLAGAMSLAYIYIAYSIAMEQHPPPWAIKVRSNCLFVHS